MFKSNKDAEILEDNDLSDEDISFDKEVETESRRRSSRANEAAVQADVSALEEQDLNEELSKPAKAIAMNQGSSMMRYLTNGLAVLGLLFVLFFLWSRLFGGGDDNSEANKEDNPVVENQDAEEKNPETEEAEEVEPVETTNLTEEQIAEYLKFEQTGNEFKITGRVTSTFDDRAADGEAGIIVEDEYRINTEFGFVEAGSVTVGDVDDVEVGDWVEVYAQGRKTFSSTASYLLDVFDSKYYVTEIDNPLPDTAPADSEDDDAANSENDESTTSLKVDDVNLARARVDGWDLIVDLEYAGCSSHSFGLDLTSASEDSIPAIKVEVTHDANNDTCEKLSSSTETLNLEPILKDLGYPSAYDLQVSGSDNSLRSFRVQ